MISSANSSLQNEIQRAIMNEMIASNGNHSASAITGRMYSQQIPIMNGSTGNRSSSKEISSYLSFLDRQFQQVYRDNDELRKENESLRRENENLRKENERLKKSTLNSISINDNTFIHENLTVNSISTTSSSTKSTSSYNINNKSKTLQ
ncbi:hypothetical protein RclHR1_04440007 [Rhizophagus clarus]|nr:hypothetical protein RclHR1_04440007 [Rhizophagus clarus]